jgi:beta-glucosidase
MKRNHVSEKKEGYNIVYQHEGPELGYSPDSGVQIITADGKLFKDFNGNGELLPYEDWRLPAIERAKDLASRLTIDEIAGLMLYSIQNKLPMPDDTYGGKPFEESGAKPYELSDLQIKFLTEDNLRHVLVSKIESPGTAARWNNRVQALVEGRTHGIPANNSSDPRHSAIADAEFSAGNGGKISMWSSLLGMAATFNPEIVEEFGKIASTEYRYLGLTTALSPQADLGTDPRWYRYASTFGSDPELVKEMTRAYCDGFQTSEGEDEIEDGWGRKSVNTMVKHWPGGGSGEGGRDAHYGNGKFAVYPGGNFSLHKIPFTEGSFKLKGKTKMASAIMPYYTISYNQTDENVGNGFSKSLITDQLRRKVGFEGVVCTDWLITHDEVHPGVHSGKPWGVEKMSEGERHYKALLAGVDQFGGNNVKAPVIEAYEMGVRELGEEVMRKRFEESARRLLLNMFRTGLFENPYVDAERCEEIVGCPEFMKKGYEQQLKSIVVLKNRRNCLPLNKECRVYIPERISPAGPNFWRVEQSEIKYDPVPDHLAERYFVKSSCAEEADIAIVFIESPHSLFMGYDLQDLEKGGNGYIPISLQYRDYTAGYARVESIAGGDPHECFMNRSYKGKRAITINASDLNLLSETRNQMGDKPVILIITMSNPMVMSEVEPLADAILISFDVQVQAILDVITGKFKPSGRLPFNMPADMRVVEEHCEDSPYDLRPYVDSEGSIYKFDFGQTL